MLSWKPRALYFPGFAAPQQCDAIMKAAKAHLAPSTLALRKGETAENTKGIRTRFVHYISYWLRIRHIFLVCFLYKCKWSDLITCKRGCVIYFIFLLWNTSSGMFMSASEDKTGTLDCIEEKIARATMIPRTHGEVYKYFMLYVQVSTSPGVSS